MHFKGSSLHNSWKRLFQEQAGLDYFQKLEAHLESEYQKFDIYPPKRDLLRCFELTAVEKVKVVILGQDPYHGPTQAHGLSFSVPNEVKVPPSLRNIQKELEIDPRVAAACGCLTSWAEQGVLLLNTVLTVRAGEAGSHRGKGWEIFTDAVLRHLSSHEEHVVFMLWGKDAQRKASLIDQEKHLVLETSHPSPLSAYRGFLGCGHFNMANEYLKSCERAPVHWTSPWIDNQSA